MTIPSPSPVVEVCGLVRTFGETRALDGRDLEVRRGECLGTAGLFTITAYAMDALHGILWYGKGLFATSTFGGVWLQIAVLLGVGLGLLTLSARLFRRRYSNP